MWLFKSFRTYYATIAYLYIKKSLIFRLFFYCESNIFSISNVILNFKLTNLEENESNAE